MGASELKKEKTTSSSFDNMPSTIQIDEIDRSASDPVSIPIVQKNFASPVKHLQRAKVPKLTTHDLMKHPSLVSDQLAKQLKLTAMAPMMSTSSIRITRAIRVLKMRNHSQGCLSSLINNYSKSRGQVLRH